MTDVLIPPTELPTSGSATDGVSDSISFGDCFWDRLGSFPVRVLNRRLDRAALSGCGSPLGSADDYGSTWTSVHCVDGVWRARLSSCCNTLLCDFCAPREQLMSRLRWRWHFEDHVAAGGELVHLVLSVPHRVGDSLSGLLDGLNAAFSAFSRSKAWRDSGIVDFVRVLHIRWSPERGWHPHFHVVGFVRPGVPVDLPEVLPGLQAGWRDRLVRAGFQRTSSRQGLVGRVFGAALEALYAWSWADEAEDDDEYHPQAHLDELADYESDGYDRDDVDEFDDDGDEGSWSTWDLARAAIAGDQRAYRKWEELAAAMHRRQVVSCSRRLDEVWAVHEAEVEAAAVVVPELPMSGAADAVPAPVVLVGNKLVARAVLAGVWDEGLRVGSSGGVLAAAGLWSEGLSCAVLVDVDARGVPLIWADSIGPAGGRGGGSVAVLCDVSVLESVEESV